MMSLEIDSSAHRPLYAWANPVMNTGAPVDHTWVTNFQLGDVRHSSIEMVVSANQHYWYCWGLFHWLGSARGARLLVTGAANLEEAICLVRPNKPCAIDAEARGTIFRYGRDGMCHQLANQVLFSTASGGEALTVSQANGYMVSSFFYGPYGLAAEAWDARRSRCGTNTKRIEAAMTTPNDDFERRAKQVLEKDDPTLLTDLLALRASVQDRLREDSSSSIEEMNLRNQEMLDQAAALLGPSRFQSIFGFPPNERINLLEDQVLEQKGGEKTSTQQGHMRDLDELFLATLKDIYYAEKKILKALPKMAKAANSDKLRAAFEKHHEETEGQVERLEKIFELLGKAPRGKKCDAIEGIIDEGREIMDEYADTPALDAGLLAAAQAVEHYEISRYGTLKAWAGKLNMPLAVKLLDETLMEEQRADQTLTDIMLDDILSERTKSA